MLSVLGSKGTRPEHGTAGMYGDASIYCDIDPRSAGIQSVISSSAPFKVLATLIFNQALSNLLQCIHAIKGKLCPILDVSEDHHALDTTRCA